MEQSILKPLKAPSVVNTATTNTREEDSGFYEDIRWKNGRI